MDVSRDKIREFWQFICPNLQLLQQSRNIVQEFWEFAQANQDADISDWTALTQNEQFMNLSQPTKVFLEADARLKMVHPMLTVFIDNVVIHLPERAIQTILEQQRRELVNQGVDVPAGLKVMPVIIRYDLTITAASPELMQLIKMVYNVFKGMVARNEVDMPPDWVVHKFRSCTSNPRELIYKGEELTDDHMDFILQRREIDKPLEGDNELELIIKVNQPLENLIQVQGDIDALRSELLVYIDDRIGDYKTFNYIHNITVIPDVLYKQLSQNFPEHYRLQPWSEFDQALDANIPKSKKCSKCHAYEENTKVIEVLEPVEFIDAGNYCDYCFKLLARALTTQRELEKEDAMSE